MPTLAALEGLLDDARQAGAQVTTAEVLGTGELAALPRATSQEAHRVVQEALTNALRHAPSEPVTVAVRVTAGDGAAPAGSDRHLAVVVRNPLAAAVRTGADRGGRGLAGMAEHVYLLRGELVAGPGTGPDAGTWVVQASFPLADSRWWPTPVRTWC